MQISVHYQAAEGEDQGTRGCRGGPLEFEVCIFLSSAGGQCGRHGNGDERAETQPSREAGRRGGGNAEASRSRPVGKDHGHAVSEASPAYQASTAAGPPNCRDSGSEAGKISSFSPHGDGTDSLLGAEGCNATAGDRDCRRQQGQEKASRRKRRICIATCGEAKPHLNKV